MSSRLRRFFSSRDFTQGIKNNRLSDNDRVSRRDHRFDSYSRVDIVYDEDNAFEFRGINKKVRNKANTCRRYIDRYRSSIDGEKR